MVIIVILTKGHLALLSQTYQVLLKRNFARLVLAIRNFKEVIDKNELALVAASEVALPFAFKQHPSTYHLAIDQISERDTFAEILFFALQQVQRRATIIQSNQLGEQVAAAWQLS